MSHSLPSANERARKISDIAQSTGKGMQAGGARVHRCWSADEEGHHFSSSHQAKGKRSKFFFHLCLLLFKLSTDHVIPTMLGRAAYSTTSLGSPFSTAISSRNSLKTYLEITLNQKPGSSITQSR